MTGNMGDIFAEMQHVQQELKNRTVEVSEGDGAISIIINGHQEVLAVKLDPAALSPENVEKLQNAAAIAINRAILESKQMWKSELSKITGGLNLPNFPGLF
jgi:hypothetical protein